MKLVIMGKGGAGKSTIVAMLAYELLKKGKRVIVVDTDESNQGLAGMLQLSSPKDLMDGVGGKKEVGKKMWEARDKGHRVSVLPDRFEIDDLPSDQISRKDDILLLQIGKVKQYGEGCACPMGGLSREFLEKLVLRDNDFVIVDTEAGLEHMGRGIEGNVDLILAVIDPSLESILMSKRIKEMATEAKKPVYFIVNKADAELTPVLLEKLNGSNVVATFPNDRRLTIATLKGDPLPSDVKGIKNLTDFVLNFKEN